MGGENYLSPYLTKGDLMGRVKIDDSKELERLRERVAELEREKSSKPTSVVENHYLNELKEIRQKGRSNAGGIQYKDVHDHINIPLYHLNGLRIGKVVGPIHPENAEQVFTRFAAIGIRLSIRQPTLEEIERYKETEEYKKLERDFQKVRQDREKSKRGSEVEKLTKAISKMVGIPEESVNQIRSPEEVSMKR